MKKDEVFSLIEGKFKEDEAKDLLINLFSQKINYHKLKNFSSQVRYGKDDVVSLNRSAILKKNLEKIQILLADAKANNLQLIISSEIKISFSAGKNENVQRTEISNSHQAQ